MCTHHAGRDSGKFPMVAGNQAQGLPPDTDTLDIKKLVAKRPGADWQRRWGRGCAVGCTGHTRGAPTCMVLRTQEGEQTAAESSRDTIAEEAAIQGTFTLAGKRGVPCP